MINDPYKVLGVPQSATSEEIKKAYRQKAKEYHPDLHPNDPNAIHKMNEVNEAYDMLTNPEKYAARRAQQQRQQSQNTYGGFGYGSQSSQRTGSSQSYGGYQGPGGWASDFSGFDFGDIFGFGFGNTQQYNTSPQPESGDSREILNAVSAIRSNRYQDALNILSHITSNFRNARWYYLSAVANSGLGNTILAVDHMQKAVQMDPNNRMYHQLLQNYRQAGQTYENNARGFDMYALNLQKICCGLFAAQFCCGPLCCLRCR